MNIIAQIRKCIENEYCQITINIFSHHDIIFKIYEKEVPIAVDPITEEIFFDAELYNGKLYAIEIEELSKIVAVIKENIEEIKTWVKD